MTTPLYPRNPNQCAGIIQLTYNITCDTHGSVHLNGQLIGAVEYENDRWTAVSFYDDMDSMWENFEHDEPYDTREEAVQGVVEARWALQGELRLMHAATMG